MLQKKHIVNTKQFYLRLIELLPLAFLVLAVNYAPLQNDIAVGGDEEWHIWRLQVFRNVVSPLFQMPNLIITIIVSVIVLIFFFRLKRLPSPFKLLIITVCILIFLVYQGYPKLPKLQYLMLRYPFFSCWLHQIGPVWNTNYYDEQVYRLIPLMATFAISWFSFWALRINKIPYLLALIAAVAFVMAPNIYYHATIFYLELPAVVLLMVVLFYIETILKESFHNVRKCPGWYALLAVGFLKETLVVIIFGIIALRLLVRGFIIFREAQFNSKNILNEIAAVFCIATPITLYLLFRVFFGEIRAYEFNYSNLTDLGLWIKAAASLWEQFGLLLVLAVAGVIVGLIKRNYLYVLAITILFILDFLFHFLENPAYVGLARFNLFLFPPLAVMGIYFLFRVNLKSKTFLIIAVAAFLITNILLSPVAVTGDKKPIGERYYPHEKAVEWLLKNRTNWPVLVGGNVSKARVDWYFRKHKYFPKAVLTRLDKSTAYMDGLKSTIFNAEKANFPLVLFHRANNTSPLSETEQTVFGYEAVKVFKNKYHSLVIYQRRSLRK